MKKSALFQDIDLETLALASGGCRKNNDHCHEPSHDKGGIKIEINVNGFLKGNGGCVTSSFGDVSSLPDIGAIGSVPGADGATDTTTTSTTIPGADTTADAPADAGLGTALPGT